MPFRALIVAAVSTAAQATEDKASLPEQVAACRQVCEARGWPVVEVVELPGQSRNYDWLHQIVAASPAYAHLVERIEAHAADLIVVRDYDRLWRTDALRAQVTALCREHRVQVYSLNQPVEPVAIDRLDASDTSRLAEVLYGFISEQENRTRVRRRAIGMRGRIRRGLHSASTPPYGYALGPPGEPIRVVPEQARWVRHAFEMRADGYSYRAIADHLADRQVPAPQGDAWHVSTIRRMLQRDTYLGAVHWADVHSDDGQHEAIIAPDLWRRVQDANEAHSMYRSKSTIRPLSGLAKCGHCGWGIGYAANSSGVLYLRCNRYTRSRALCQAGHWRADAVEAQVMAEVIGALEDPETWAEAQRQRIDEGAISRELAALEATLFDGESRWRRWNDLYERGAISADELLGHRERIEAQTRDARERRDALERQRVDLAESAQRMADLGSMLAVIPALADGDLRELYGLLLRRVTLYKPQRIALDWR